MQADNSWVFRHSDIDVDTVCAALMVCRAWRDYLCSDEFLSWTRLAFLRNPEANRVCGENNQRRLVLAKRLATIFKAIVENPQLPEHFPLMKILPNSYCCYRELVVGGYVWGRLDGMLVFLSLPVDYFHIYLSGVYSAELRAWAAQQPTPHNPALCYPFVQKALRNVHDFFGCDLHRVRHRDREAAEELMLQHYTTILSRLGIAYTVNSYWTAEPPAKRQKKQRELKVLR